MSGAGPKPQESRRRGGGLLRGLRGSGWLRALTARLIAAYLRLVRLSGRWEVLGAESRAAVMSAEGRQILACWHGRLAMFPTERSVPGAVKALISRNRDGDLVARIMDSFEIDTLRGSTEDPRKPWRRRGGGMVFLEALSAFRGAPDLRIALTPDGPRGPNMRLHPGVALLSARAGVPVVPFTFSARWGIVLGSWDRFLLPLPFTRGVIAWGPPLDPPGGSDKATLADHRTRIEAALTALTREADARMGRTTPEPG